MLSHSVEVSLLSRNYVKPFLKGEEGRGGEVERRREGGEGRGGGKGREEKVGGKGREEKEEGRGGRRRGKGRGGRRRWKGRVGRRRRREGEGGEGGGEECRQERVIKK